MDKFQFAKLVSFVAGLVSRSLDDYELKDLDNLTTVAQSEPKPLVNLTPLFTAIIQRRKIEAIKEYRTLTGFGLKESKDEIERLMYEMAVKLPDPYIEKKEGA